MLAILVTIIHVIVCFILIAVILLQAGKGQGLAGASFGGGNVQSLLGTKGADFMTKATTVAAIGFMLTCLTLSFIETQKSRSLLQSSSAAAPLDVDQIKKALEKVKAEADASGIEQTAENMQEAAEGAASETVDTAAALRSELEEAADSAQAEVETVAQDIAKIAEGAAQQ